eukprot:610526-Pyramimonas_sp.AAC.1
MYWTIGNFGYPILSNEDSWFTISAARSTLIDRLPGGASEAIKYMLKTFFGLPVGPDLRHGVTICIDGRPRVVWGSLKTVIQDERAHKFCFHMKGATAHKLCGLCQNAVVFNSTLLPDPTGWLVPSDCTDITKFKLHTAETVRGSQKRLHDVASQPDSKGE